MSETNALALADQPHFSASLTPHRSLGRTGFAVLMAVLLTGWLATGIVFLNNGAWPVFGFFGLDVLLVYVAFRTNYRAARVREEVSLSRTSLDIRKTSPSGKTVSHKLNPFWTRFHVSRHDEIGITRMMVEARNASIPLGGFLNPADRESFAAAFSHAMSVAKAG